MAYHRKPNPAKKPTKEVLRLRKKENKQKLKEKRARLVVKNLPFDTTEENLREHFAKYGDIAEIQILKKEDGKLLGCAFIQFKLVQKARKAKHHTNNHPFLGRNLDVDFAMPKKLFEANKMKKEAEVKEEDCDIKVKEEPIDYNEGKQMEVDVNTTIKEENVDEEENTNLSDSKNMSVDKVEVSSEEEGLDSEDEELSSDKNEELSSDENEQLNSDKYTEDEKMSVKELESKPRVVSNDITEGRTIFVKNVPFTATNEDLRECMSQFGPIYYALICIDKMTEHSKGTGFVKFRHKDDAEKALQAGTELTLLGNILDCHPALNRNDIQSKQDQKNKEKNQAKDSRNLYLVKEGVIMAGSKAAEGISSLDMGKRLQLEQFKSQMLKNLNMFVSKQRLVIHNLPPNFNDNKLRILCSKFLDKKIKIREARIMRDLKNVDAKGIGKSKEFGFVTLDSHEGALKLLRSLNNNPNIFSKSKRPIVSFSIEKKSAMKTKLKRLERSRLKNPKSKIFDPNLLKEEKQKDKNQEKEINNTDETLNQFSGVPAKRGIQKMRSKFKLSAQAAKHHENIKKEKKKKKMATKTLKQKKAEFTKQERQKVNKSKMDFDNFSKLVSTYKKTISNAPNFKKKWYS